MSQPTRLVDLAKTLRSKNAGVDLITFDIFFDDEARFQRVVDSKALTRESIAELFRTTPEAVVTFLELPPLKAIKITIRRDRPSGSPGDTDIFGAQQYAPLVGVVIP
ncbi:MULTISPECIES: DUF4387 domain-containing protein [Micromonospora]|uniref:DUF4387 domain-containing protein n=1 Tax=Micromonospora TaxID=1873 RepID=UPI00098D4A8F|nr:MULTISPECIES: DUF4387 domain-containing protein [unclassified Micromonospora]MDI5937492.1 DUF4387 domain-containing protein [Micromonospora sp. DH15]OON28114.1 acyl-CoA synthetase [Micromonospora sp. Rc5]